MAKENDQAKQAKSRARDVEFVRSLARWKRPPPAILCNPDHEAKVRELVAEAGVDIPVGADPETNSFMKAPNKPCLTREYPELAKRLRERPEEFRRARDGERREEPVEIRGRKREEAPKGHATVRESADLLGVTKQAVRQRTDRGTLPVMPGAATEGAGEPRYYIPWEALREAKRRQQATTDILSPVADTPADEDQARGPVRVTVHRPELPRTVRIETGLWGTEVHLDGYPSAF